MPILVAAGGTLRSCQLYRPGPCCFGPCRSSIGTRSPPTSTTQLERLVLLQIDMVWQEGIGNSKSAKRLMTEALQCLCLPLPTIHQKCTLS